MKENNLSADSLNLLIKLHQEKKINDESFYLLLKCRKDCEIEQAFSSIYSITKSDCEKIVWIVLTEMPGFAEEDNKKQNLNDHDWILFRELLMNNGFLIKKKIEDEELYTTFRFIENSVEKMQAFPFSNNKKLNQYIIKIKLYNFETIYLLNPELLARARK